jgi:HEAT repeat protein
MRAAAIEIMGIFGTDNLPFILRAAIQDKDPFVRLRAVYGLRHIGTPQAVQGLKLVSQDPDPVVRKEAETHLEWLRGEQAPRPEEK